MGGILTYLRELLFGVKKLDLIIIGLDNAGKTTLLNVLAHGHPIETLPTIGINVKQMKHEGIKINVWDIGGQEKFREEWQTYAQNCHCIVFVVDTADPKRLEEAKRELHNLLEHQELHTRPILIVANKIDLPNHIEKPELIKGLNLDYITENPVGILEVSAIEQTNIDKVIEWMVEKAPQ